MFTTLWVGRARNRGLVPGKCKIFLSFSEVSRPALNQHVPWLLPKVKAAVT